MRQKYSENVNFHPFVGEKYFDSRYGVRVLVLGESHYGHPEDMAHDFTQHVVTKHAYCSGFPFFSKITSVLRGNTTYPSDAERFDAWQHVAFYNFVQTFVAEESRVAPTREEWKAAQTPFREVVRVLEPDVILVLGRRLWDEIEPLPPEYPVEWCGITHPSGGMSYSPSIAALAESIAKAGGSFATDNLTMEPKITITVELPENVAAALAQFVKRTGLSDAREKATSDDEAYAIMDGVNAVMRALAEEGHDPR